MDEVTLKKMVAELYHRGPDAEGFYSSGDYHAGMSRLSINDLVTGNQPLFNRDKSVALFYNGEIYNSPHLRSGLERKGYSFRTHSDGEVICHLYDEYAEGLFEKLDGMFAVALWIEREKKLILARDIAGEKPLYFTRLSKNEIAFASEIKSLRLFPNLDLKLNYQAMWDLITLLWIPEPDTIYNSVQALMPGHILIMDDSGIKIRRYGRGVRKENRGICDYSLIRETRRVVEEAVRSRLLSDVPVGCFLSGGLDSSLVATLAKQHINNLDTFTIGFEDIPDPYHGYADESVFARDYARKLGTRHHTIKVNSDTFLGLLDTFCEYGDEPLAISSGLGILVIAKAAKESGIKVLLSGDGADESFGGYSWYEHLAFRTKKRNRSEYKNSSVSFQNFGMPIRDRLNIISGYSPQKKAWAWHYYASEVEKEDLFASCVSRGARSSLRFFKEFKPASEWTANDYIRQDRIFYLPNEMLRKVDRMTMAYSVEGRVPFVAPGILSLAGKLKYRHLVSGGTLKWLLRKSFEKTLPAEILNRPKHGFNVPIDHWLKNKWFFLVKEAFSKNSALYKLGFIHRKSAQIATDMLNDKMRLNGHTIFAYIMLNKWLEKYS